MRRAETRRDLKEEAIAGLKALGAITITALGIGVSLNVGAERRAEVREAISYCLHDPSLTGQTESEIISNVVACTNETMGKIATNNIQVKTIIEEMR